jgi:hypothetical protein
MCSFISLNFNEDIDNGNVDAKVAPFPSGLFSARILPPGF